MSPGNFPREGAKARCGHCRKAYSWLSRFPSWHLSDRNYPPPPPTTPNPPVSMDCITAALVQTYHQYLLQDAEASASTPPDATTSVTFESDASGNAEVCVQGLIPRLVEFYQYITDAPAIRVTMLNSVLPRLNWLENTRRFKRKEWIFLNA